MQNLTLSIDPKVLSGVRKYALDRNTTVNGLVREFLTSISTQDDRVAEARKQLMELSKESKLDIGDKRVTRDGLHER